MPSDFQFRRMFLTTALVAPLFTALPIPAFALTENSARDLVGRLVGEINKVIVSTKSDSAKIRDFEKIFVRYADVVIMARYALGVDARRASKSQMNSFTKAFQG